MTFEWDPQKAAANIAKHGVHFEDAVMLFHMPLTWYQMDPEHSDQEVREKLLRECEKGILVVIFTQRDPDRIRIISARQATRTERIDYAQRRGI